MIKIDFFFVLIGIHEDIYFLNFQYKNESLDYFSEKPL